MELMVLGFAALVCVLLWLVKVGVRARGPASLDGWGLARFLIVMAVLCALMIWAVG